MLRRSVILSGCLARPFHTLWLGWLFTLTLVLPGVGAITLRVQRPAFFVAPR
ncbi:hypothetical protein KUV28_13575 [Ferrimonas balearica]|nr:hypothetical protein [Ferrimonas balearica]